jgi:molybdenum cofactor cytidylyltransferase
MTAIIILAAGASTRLGRSKQTVPYKGSSLLKHTIKVAVDTDLGPVIVVIGANEKEISAHIEQEAVTIVLNKDYQEGIASSIRTGLNEVQEHHKDCENIILMVCDQPHVNKELLTSLLDTKNSTNKPIAASAYKDTIGVPALFDKHFIPELLSLQGEEGGKKILLKHHESVAVVPFPSGEIDIDTPADLDSLAR